jgi:hypothetical protein
MNYDNNTCQGQLLAQCEWVALQDIHAHSSVGAVVPRQGERRTSGQNFAATEVWPAAVVWPISGQKYFIQFLTYYYNKPRQFSSQCSKMPYQLSGGKCITFTCRSFNIVCAFNIYASENISLFNLLKTKRNLLYIRNQSVPRCKHFPPRL